MAERGILGKEVAAISGEHLPISRVSTAITAFVGRTLKGPVNKPVTITSVQQFQQIFGGLWQPSPLSYAVEQYFENGGRTAIIVRVVNGAHPPTINLPAGSTSLRLVALNPGSREYLRASVDYDGITDSEPDRFNLVIQRVRSPGSELIEDQEIFRRLSIEPGSGRFVTDVLLESRIVRVTGTVPNQRPLCTTRTNGSSLVGYVHSNADGHDGKPLTDYDVIGSERDGTGIFALRQAGGFNLLCIPPLARDQDVGVSTLLVAARFCREQHAILVVDPPTEWRSPQAALDGIRAWPFRSENAVMYFPRVQAFDRLRNRQEIFGSCGVAAGIIARGDEACPVWSAAEGEEPLLRPGYRPALPVSEAERQRLAKAGINTLQTVRSSTRTHLSACTLAAGLSSCAPVWKYLSARRLALFIMSSIERGTRWMVFRRNAPDVWDHAKEQVEVFLESLAQDGAFAGANPDESYFVICDERVNPPKAIADGTVNLLFGFAITKPGDFHTCMVTHRPEGSRVRPVAVNRMITSQQRVAWEIETAILR